MLGDLEQQGEIERDFIMDVVGLRRRIQTLYDETRSLAQQSRWVEHLSQAVLLLGCLQYLGWNPWISRILGRMAWSYIRLNESAHAKRLLLFSEGYHVWQAAANYYWASEYSYRSNHEKWGREFIYEFRRICKEKLDLAEKEDLRLAVAFYEKLVEQESTDPLFLETNNQSDIGRYLELRARLNSSPQDFWDAALHYELAGLHPYASFNRAFYYICLARQPNHLIDQRVALFKSALQEVAGRPIFADREVKDLLQRYLEARIACCELIINSEAAGRDPRRVADIEAGYKHIHSLVRGQGELIEGLKPMAEIAAKFLSLSRKQAWGKLLDFIDSLDPIVCGTEVSRAIELDKCLDNIQPFMPSLSFLATKEEE